MARKATLSPFTRFAKEPSYVTDFSLRFRQVHLDFHTSPAIEGIGADFDPDEFGETLTKAHVNSITVFARCHHGHLYYPSTKFPERIHPHLARPNLLGEQIEACHKRGIRAPIYVTIQWDQFTADLHRDWLVIEESGKIQGTAPLQPGFYRNLDVFHPGYRQFLFEHVAEIMDTLPVDGFFFDIVSPRPSLAKYWLDAMDAEGVNPEVAVERYRFAVKMLQEWECEMSAFVRAKVPDATIFYNSGHVGPRLRPNVDAYSHFELESLPSGGWGYLHFPQAMRYGRTLGKECLGMTGKFHTSWGDFGSYKNPAALQFECFQMLALGAKCSVGDQLPPSGKLDSLTYDLIGSVYAEVEKKEVYTEGAVPVNEVGVLTPEAVFWRNGLDVERQNPAVLGAIRLLHELKVQYDIIDDTEDFTRYKVLILPDTVTLDVTIAAKIEAYVAGGGAVIASHHSGLTSDKSAFALPSLGVQAVGEIPASPDFIVPGDAFAGRLPTHPHVMYKRGFAVSPIANAEVLATVQSPYFERNWRHFCSHAHTPASGQDAGYPGVVANGKCVYLAHPVFAQYQENAPRWCRELVGGALDRVLPQRLVTIDGPTGIISALNRQAKDNRYVLHLLYYIPERRGQAFDIIEDIVPLYNLPIKLALAEPLASIEDAGTCDSLPFTQEDGLVTVTLPILEGHTILVLKTGD